MHTWPGPHRIPLPAPHSHWPCALQVSPPRWLQSMHAMPFAPHLLAACAVLHAPLSQQPFEHVAQPEHTPPSRQAWPPPQLWQVAPPLPHAPAIEPPSHVPPSTEQQPAHDSGSHEHFPAWQRSPAPQGAPLPHWQCPLAH
jgi:hypothetical protein